MKNTTPPYGHLVKRSRKTVWLALLLLAALAAVFLISMNLGAVKLTPAQVIHTLFGGGDAREHLILFKLRLPRIVIAVLIGGGLAVSGAIMQGLTRNPLAEPGILGINAGAGLAILIYAAYFPVVTLGTAFMMPLFALAGAMLTAVLIYSLAFRRSEGLSPTSLVLNGIGIAAGVSAAMIVISVRLTPEKYQSVYIWLAGSISGTTWDYVLALLPWILVLLPYVFYKSRVLNVLSLGDKTALGLGANLEKDRFGLLAAAVCLAAACVASGGSISFVGLIGPHLARRLVGPNYKHLLPVSALLGALLVLIGDTIGRSVMHTGEVPTGIVVAVIGAPYFLYLLAKAKA
ncbi:FecCD family ABC transporter permease [Paenibacillus pinistramenti]|uniref:FecCD family ABC transporter permease n=1 Tax=Paenibacillus pinistramenti TaxID=1768003 RepID=UPI0011097B84|nr:iron ABC transporter permease [Paenibacillus pinistramenti]